MNELSAMIWIEARKAIRCRMPLWTALGSLYMPLRDRLLDLRLQESGNSQTAWPDQRQSQPDSLRYDRLAYLPGTVGQLMAAAGFLLFILIISWVFGREFADGTLKDCWPCPFSTPAFSWPSLSWWRSGPSPWPSLFSSPALRWGRSSNSPEARSPCFFKAVTWYS